MRHTRLPGSRWEVSPGYHLWGERKSGEQNALPLLVTGDRQARKPANDGRPHTAVEVLTELANDLVSGAEKTDSITEQPSREGCLG